MNDVTYIASFVPLWIAMASLYYRIGKVEQQVVDLFNLLDGFINEKMRGEEKI